MWHARLMTDVPARSTKPHALTGLEIAAILAIIVTWGINNAAGKLATETMPPLLVGARQHSSRRTGSAVVSGTWSRKTAEP